MLSSRESPRPGSASSLSVSPSLSAPSAGPGSENNLGASVLEERFDRWCLCSLCEQRYHGVVYHALGWACWKTYVGQPEAHWTRRLAMTALGNGLSGAEHHEAALSVREAELSMLRRVGASEGNILIVKGNLAMTYRALERNEEALRLRREVYSGSLNIHGEEDRQVLLSVNNYADSLVDLQRFEEAKTLLRKTIPVARRIIGENDKLTLKMRWAYAWTLCDDTGATLDDLRESVKTLEETVPTARRVFGGTNPTTMMIEGHLQDARAALRARETPTPSN